jgi:hypothetical protein
MESTPRLRLSHALIEFADFLLHELVSTNNTVNKRKQIKKPVAFLIKKNSQTPNRFNSKQRLRGESNYFLFPLRRDISNDKNKATCQRGNNFQPVEIMLGRRQGNSKRMQQSFA